MRPNEIKNTIRAGLFVSILLFMASIITFLIGKESAFLEHKSVIKTEFADVQFLKTGSPVLLKGIKVGKVDKISIEGGPHVTVRLQIVDAYLKLIKVDSFASIQTQGMLGDKYIEIQGGKNESKSLEDGENLPSTDSGGMDAFINKGENILENANKVLGRVNEILTDLNADQQIGNIVKNIKTISAQFEKISSHLESVSSELSQSKLASTAKNLNDISNRIKKGPGSLHSFIYDRTVYDDLRTLLGGAQRNKVLKYFIRESIRNSDKLK